MSTALATKAQDTTGLGVGGQGEGDEALIPNSGSNYDILLLGQGNFECSDTIPAS